MRSGIGRLAIILLVGVMAVTIVLAGGTIVLLPQSAYADPGWWDGSWSCRQPITITEQTGSSLTDYQVKITVSYDSDMQPDFDDIRFIDSDDLTELSHWRESYSASSSASFWVKLSLLASEAKTIYMYYGNSGASSASDGVATFVFFDDFLGTSLDGTKWNPWNADVSVSDSVVTITNTGAWGGIVSVTEYSLPYIFVARAQKTTTIGVGQVGLEKWYVSTGDNTLNVFDAWDTSTPQVYYTRKYDGTSQWDEVGTWDLSTWYHYEIKGKSDEVKYYRDGALQNTETTLTAIPVGTMSVKLKSEAINDQLLVDYCFIRKYASSEPTVSFGSEEIRPSSPTVDAVALYQSDESTLINLGGSMDPQVEYAVKVSVTDNNTLDDVNEVKVTIFYDSVGDDPAAPGTSDTKTCAIITWTKGSGWTIDPSASTTWVLVTGNCKTPTMSATTGDWWAHFKPGKVATKSGTADDWDIYAKATDAAAGSGELYARDYEMNWYGEIAVNTASVDWGTVALGSDFADNEQTDISVTYIANGAYSEQVKASNPWVAPPNQVTLNEAGTPGDGEFSLKAGNGGTPFHDDFEEHNVGDTPDGWSLSLAYGSGTLSVQEEGTNNVMDYTHTTGDEGEPHIAVGDTSWTDYTYEAKMRIVTEASHHGLEFRFADRNNTCYCGVSDPTSGIVQLWKRTTATDWVQIGGDWSITPPGNTWHDWKVVVSGTNIKVYWDGAYLGEGDLGPGELTSGKIGCFAGYGGQTRYDDFSVHSSTVLVPSADYATFDTGIQTGEGGNTDTSNTLWLKLGPSGIPDVTYSGTIYYRIAQ